MSLRFIPSALSHKDLRVSPSPADQLRFTLIGTESRWRNWCRAYDLLVLPRAYHEPFGRRSREPRSAPSTRRPPTIRQTPRLRQRDRILWVWLSRFWANWRSCMIIVKPDTVVRWHRDGFRLYWRWKSRSKPGRPRIHAEIRKLIRPMSRDNATWGSPRIQSELALLGCRERRACPQRSSGLTHAFGEEKGVSRPSRSPAMLGASCQNAPGWSSRYGQEGFPANSRVWTSCLPRY